jgi:hypothetical protein
MTKTAPVVEIVEANLDRPDHQQAVLDLTDRFYRRFGFEHVVTKLATRPEKASGTPEMWDAAEEALRAALGDRPYELKEGDGAFYGPKIDFHVKDSIGRSWQLATVQVDFGIAERFDLSYVAPDGSPLVVGGKTGTAQKVDPRSGRYSSERLSSFVVGSSTSEPSGPSAWARALAQYRSSFRRNRTEPKEPGAKKKLEWLGARLPRGAMRYTQSEKMEIIRLVEESETSAKITLEELDQGGKTGRVETPLYHGTCGVFWALHYLEDVGAATLSRSYAAELHPLLAVLECRLISAHRASSGHPRHGVACHLQHLRGVAERVAALQAVRFRHAHVL